MTVIPLRSRITITSSCVTDLERLRFSSLPKAVKSEVKIHGDKFDIDDEPQVIVDKVCCKHTGKAYATQIGPIIRGSVDRKPTIKHPCDLVTLAALKRGLEAVVQPSPDFVKLIQLEFKALAKLIHGYIHKEGGIIIDVNDWLSNHPKVYQDKIIKDKDNDVKKYVYDIFGKVEMQQTEVDPDDHDTAKNGLKERCIYGPQNRKKYYTGPFMWAMEKLLHRNNKVYCGMKNWTQICSALNDAEEAILNEHKRVMANKFKFNEEYQAFVASKMEKNFELIGVEADFSRYDSTQVKEILEAFADFVQDISSNPLIDWMDDQSAQELNDYVRNSVKLRLFAFQGQVQAKVHTRASGDTWTTFGNTVTSMVLWSVVLQRFGFNPNLDGYKCGFKPVFMMMKGDDMIGLIAKQHLKFFEDAVNQGFNRDNLPTPHGVGCIVKVVESGPIDTRSYLSNYFFRRSNGGLRMIRKPERVFLTLGLSTQYKIGMGDKAARELLFAKGQCLLAWGEGLPIFDFLARKMIKLGAPNLYRVEYADKARICTDVQESDYFDCAMWMYERYGLTISDIKLIEHQIGEINSDLAEVVIPLLDKFTKDF